MSHVDEGALHAYLDGALDEYPAAEARRVRDHLEDCAECAERLEVERRVRGDASAMLGLAAPRVEAPSFEELRAYVRATRRRPAPGALRLYRMGWAASVVLALGVGWMVGGGLDAPVERAPVGSRLEALEAARNDRVGDAAVGAPGSGQAGTVLPMSMSAAATPPAVEDDRPAGGAPSLRTELAEVTAERTRSARAGLAQLGELPESLDLRQRRAGEPGAEAFDVDASPVEVLAARDVVDPSEAGVATGAILESAPIESAGAAADTPADSPATAGNEAERTAAAGVARSAVETLTPSGGFALSSARAPSAPAPDEVRENEEEEVQLLVPGLEVASVTSLAEGTSALGLHIQQWLDGGGVLDVYHLSPGVEPSVLPPLEAGLGEVRKERAGGWVVLRGPLAADALRDLLARLDPGA